MTSAIGTVPEPAIAPLPSPRRLRYQRFLTFYLPLLNRLVFRFFPAYFRRGVVTKFNWLASQGHDAPANLPIYVVGFLGSAIGQGIGAQLTVQALEMLGYPVHAVDVGAMFDLADFPADKSVPFMEEGPGAVIFHFNPDALIFSILAAGPAALRNKRIIGYWAWETRAIPASWVRALPYLDEIWVPSAFVADAVRPFTQKPVHVVPHPVAMLPTGVSRRVDFGMPDGQFTVLAMASFLSTFDRKNLLGAVDAFRTAFGDDPGVKLILKVTHASRATAHVQWLLADHIGDAPNIEIMEKLMRAQDVRDLVASADVFLSLHRAEGFGLVLAEAMQAGTAVIATDYSGNTDFMDQESGAMVSATMVPAVDSQGFFMDETNLWAEPSVAEAAAWLRRLAEDPALRMTLATKARERVADQLGTAGFRNAIRKALGDISAKIAEDRIRL